MLAFGRILTVYVHKPDTRAQSTGQALLGLLRCFRNAESL